MLFKHKTLRHSVETFPPSFIINFFLEYSLMQDIPPARNYWFIFEIIWIVFTSVIKELSSFFWPVTAIFNFCTVLAILATSMTLWCEWRLKIIYFRHFRRKQMSFLTTNLEQKLYCNVVVLIQDFWMALILSVLQIKRTRY